MRGQHTHFHSEDMSEADSSPPAKTQTDWVGVGLLLQVPRGWNVRKSSWKAIGYELFIDKMLQAAKNSPCMDSCIHLLDQSSRCTVVWKLPSSIVIVMALLDGCHLLASRNPLVPRSCNISAWFNTTVGRQLMIVFTVNNSVSQASSSLVYTMSISIYQNPQWRL